MANPFTVSIEMEDMARCLKDSTWEIEKLMHTSAALAADICTRRGIPLQNIIEHRDPFLRKFGNNHADCGPYFNIESFRTSVGLAIAQRPLLRTLMLKFPRPQAVLAGNHPSYPEAKCPKVLG
jgi:hypothetical protein